MPYLTVNTNVIIDDKQSRHISRELSQLISKETGKPERYVMINLSAGMRMLFDGSDAPLAYMECKSIGLSRSQTQTLSASLCQLLKKHLVIEKDRVYIEFSNCPAEYWGWNGSTFE